MIKVWQTILHAGEEQVRAGIRRTDKAINDEVRFFARLGSALFSAREKGVDAFSAIEAIVPSQTFSDSVREAGELARDENFNPLALITEHYPQLRR